MKYSENSKNMDLKLEHKKLTFKYLSKKNLLDVKNKV